MGVRGVSQNEKVGLTWFLILRRFVALETERGVLV